VFRDHATFEPRSVAIPTLVRIKPGSLDRVGIYLRRAKLGRVEVLHSEGLPDELLSRLIAGLEREGIESAAPTSIGDASQEGAEALAEGSAPASRAIVGLGGGKALDAAKYASSRSGLPYLAVPTSLSNDGFCSPQASLTVGGRRQSLPATMPYGVVVDTEVCLRAPRRLWLSGVGDLVAKLTAVRDWKLAFHQAGTAVDDFAALLSDASVYQFIGKPEFSLEGMQLLATALMLNGVSMAVCGSSRPASGSEHLISHALDAIVKPPRLHGFQVGLATYLVSQLHRSDTETIGRLFDRTGFWDACAEEPFSRRTWVEAIRMAPTMKQDFYTILSQPGQIERLISILESDPQVQRCLVDGM
jgi:glycerol-1-phosphate dehydrogenase [NAD(P)+]